MSRLMLLLATCVALLSPSETADNLGFLVENGIFTHCTALKTQLATINYEIGIPLEESLKYFAKVKGSIENFKQKPAFVAGSPKGQYKNFTLPAQEDFEAIGVLLNLVYKLTSANELTPPTRCYYEGTTLSVQQLSEGSAYLLELVTRIGDSWTGSEILGDSGKMATVQDYISELNSIGTEWRAILETFIAEYDSLRSKEVPSQLSGKLESAACLNVSFFENETVQFCKEGKIRLQCVIEFSFPIDTQKSILMQPVSYNGIELGKFNERLTFVNHPESKMIQTLACENNTIFNPRAPLCTTKTDTSECNLGLTHGILTTFYPIVISSLKVFLLWTMECQFRMIKRVNIQQQLMGNPHICSCQLQFTLTLKLWQTMIQWKQYLLTKGKQKMRF